MVSHLKVELIRELARDLCLSGSNEKSAQVVSAFLRGIQPALQSVIVFVPDSEDLTQPRLLAFHTDTPHADDIRNAVLRSDVGLLGLAAGSSSALRLSGEELRPISALGSEGSAVVAPLRVRVTEGDIELLGCLYVGATSEEALTEDHRVVIETVSHLLAMAFEGGRLRDELRHMAQTDRLTGLCNSQRFQETLRAELATAQHHNLPLSLLLTDVDHFLKFNDALSYECGDIMLKEMSNLLKEQVGPGDLIARFRGGEFALLLKNIGSDRAIIIGERIRQSYEARYANHEVPLTLSIGVASYPEHAASSEDLIRLAGDRQYDAKRAGRNRVCASPGE